MHHPFAKCCYRCRVTRKNQSVELASRLRPPSLLVQFSRSHTPLMFIRTLISATGAVACAFVVTGCNTVHKEVDVNGLLRSLRKELSAQSDNVQKLNMTTSMSIESFPLVKEVCENTFAKPNYSFDGSKMRIKVNKHGYKLPNGENGGAMLYRHQYAVCFDFYPVAEAAYQEAVFVQYMGTIKAGFGEVFKTIQTITGGHMGLLQDAQFHLNTTVANSTWGAIAGKNYTEETNRVQYLKVSPLEMKTVNKYDAEKYKDLMAFELLHVNVTRVNGELQIATVAQAVVEHAFSPVSASEVTPVVSTTVKEGPLASSRHTS